MCGIAGILDRAPRPLAPERIRRMAAAMAHRGPDHEACYEGPGLALAHRRLSIVDQDPRGHQPMTEVHGRYTIVFNGEIFNFKEVKARLDYPWRTETDTEVVLAAYAAMGPACLEMLNGMFAIAIWDQEKEELFLARDRMGIKPLYYTESDGNLLFASEVRALLQGLEKAPGINRAGLRSYLCYQTVYGAGTILSGVQMLPAGHYCLWRRQGGLQGVQSFWSLSQHASGAARTQSREEIKAEIQRLLRDSVERRLMADVPLGAFLSGGIDSSAIVALMSQVSSGPVDTFSVVFQDKDYDESTWSEMMAKKYQTRHHPILLRPESFLEKLPEALQAMDHPSGDGINSYVVSQVTREQGITVALSGLGGDELFAGYPIFQQLPGILGKKPLWMLPAPLRKGMAALMGLAPASRRWEKYQQILRAPKGDFESIYRIFRTIYRPELAARLSGYAQGHPIDLLGWNSDTFQGLPGLSQISVAEMASYTQAVLLRDTDQMSMAHALEVRVPFFDHTLVEYVLGIPDTEKQPRYAKQLLVESLGDLLPDEVVHRKKMGFVFPWEKWIRNELRDFCAQRIRRMQDRNLLDADLLGRIWNEFQQGKGEWLWTHIWLPVILDEWMHQNGIEA